MKIVLLQISRPIAIIFRAIVRVDETSKKNKKKTCNSALERIILFFIALSTYCNSNTNKNDKSLAIFSCSTGELPRRFVGLE